MSIAQTWFGRIDRQAAQQIRVDLVAGLRLRRARPAIERLDPHPPHQRRHVLAADLRRPRRQQIAQHPAARERVTPDAARRSAA